MNGIDRWWRGAVVYQIYPRSFLDSNADGIGDIGGIRARLDYVKSLGVDAIWLSPIHPSPNHDYSYDVADYFGVAAEFGGMDQFERLLEEAKSLGLKVVLDEVLSHTSHRHPWFKESASSRTNSKADWYVWADAKDDGTPPNNWLAAFGGPAWSWNPLRRQYYHHKFLRQQPKLNFHNPDARRAALDVLRFWLDKGVDGFRLDVANTFIHDQRLADNPPVPMEERRDSHWAHAARLQRHVQDSNRPENGEVLREIRALADSYPDRFVFGEFHEEPMLLPRYSGGASGLHSFYTFWFFHPSSLDGSSIRAHYEKALAPLAEVWPCVTFSNHDVVRPVSRWPGGAPEVARPALAQLSNAVLLALRGTALMYQGEELGLPDADIAEEDIRDPFGTLYYPIFKGRDGCRTPMPWRSTEPHAGFSTARPWLPIPAAHLELSVDRQEADERSTLHATRRLIRARRSLPVLREGAIVFRGAHDPLIRFERTDGEERALCLFNPTDDECRATLPEGRWVPTAFHVNGWTSDGRAVVLGPYGGVVLQLSTGSAR